MSPKTDPRILRTRNLLLNSIGFLLKEKDINKLSVKEITDRATLNRATLYDHYRDKFELFEEYIDAQYRSKVQQKLKVKTECSDALRTIIEGTFEFLVTMGLSCSSKSHQTKSLIEAKIQSYLYNIFYDYKIKNNEARLEPFQVEIEATTMSWLIYGIGMKWVHNESKKSLSDFVSYTIEVLKKPLLAHGQPYELVVIN